jgi:hypothetical protein
VTEAEALTRTIVEIFDTGAFALIPSAIAHGYVDHQGLGEQEIRGPDGFREVVEEARRDEGGAGRRPAPGAAAPLPRGRSDLLQVVAEYSV